MHQNLIKQPPRDTKTDYKIADRVSVSRKIITLIDKIQQVFAAHKESKLPNPKTNIGIYPWFDRYRQSVLNGKSTGKRGISVCLVGRLV